MEATDAQVCGRCQAGFGVEEMVGILDAGVSVENLLLIIEWCLDARSSRWIM
jgi:hypothetical protein